MVFLLSEKKGGKINKLGIFSQQVHVWWFEHVVIMYMWLEVMLVPTGDFFHWHANIPIERSR